MTVDASLVIPSYGGERRLPVLFAALREQTFRGTWEAIVVLDGVIDGSLAVIEKHRGELPVRVVELPENRGRPAALNAGFREATGRVLIRCDDDLEPAPDYLNRHAAAHAGSEEVGVVGLCLNVLPDNAYARVYGRTADERFRVDAYAVPAADTWRYWAGNCSVTREVYDRVGDYDESFREYGWEDVDWGFRLHLAGFSVAIDPSLETRHHAASTSTAVRVERAYLSGMARQRFETKHALTRHADVPVGMKAQLWGTLVSLAAKRSRSSVEWWAERTEALLDRLPASIGNKLVALQVESAAIAGFSH